MGIGEGCVWSAWGGGGKGQGVRLSGAYLTRYGLSTCYRCTQARGVCPGLQARSGPASLTRRGVRRGR